MSNNSVAFVADDFAGRHVTCAPHARSLIRPLIMNYCSTFGMILMMNFGKIPTKMNGMTFLRLISLRSYLTFGMMHLVIRSTVLIPLS